MRIPGVKRLRTAYRWGRSRLLSRALILGYHRIAAPDHDPYGICVSPENFRRHLEELRRVAQPIRLAELVTGLASGEVPAGSVALTFDDAYVETLQVAEPLLAEYTVPATVFVSTSGLGRETWWDQLHRLLRAPDVIPDRLDLRAGRFVYEWSLAGKHPPQRWGDEERGREALHLNLYRRLLFTTMEDREAVMAGLRSWIGESPETPPETRLLSERELTELAVSTLVDVGSHTVTHPMLATLPQEAQEWEVGSSRAFLENLLGREVSLLSYPNGSFDSVTEEVVRGAGFAGACGSHRDVVTPGSNRYRLPRFWPSDSADALSGPFRLWLGR